MLVNRLSTIAFGAQPPPGSTPLAGPAAAILVGIGLVGIGLTRVVFVTISVPIHTESMQAAAAAGVQTRRPEGVPR